MRISKMMTKIVTVRSNSMHNRMMTIFNRQKEKEANKIKNKNKSTKVFKITKAFKKTKK